jgi:hypothetical protein
MSDWNLPLEGQGTPPYDTGQSFPGPESPGPGQGSGAPGSGHPPGPGLPSRYAPPAWRSRRVIRLVSICATLVIVIVGVLNSLRGHPTWKLTAPPIAAGMPRDTSTLDTLDLGSAVADARSAITSLSGYGTLKSSVSAVYQRGAGPSVEFVGFNGAFKETVELRSYQHARVTSVSPGPHGGVAECARSTIATLCQWSTSSTVGDVVIRTSTLGGSVPIGTADSLMIKIRNSVEHHA